MIQEWYRNDTGMLQWTLEFCLRKALRLIFPPDNPCIHKIFSSLPEGRSRIGRPADESSTTRPPPQVSARWSCRLLYCIQTIIFTEILDRRRFDSHLGLGTFGQRNLYFFYPLFFHSLVLLKAQPFPHRHWPYLAAKKICTFSFWTPIEYLPLPLDICCVLDIFIWLILLVSPDGGRTQNQWVPSPGPYHWATPTVEWGLKLRNFI